MIFCRYSMMVCNIVNMYYFLCNKLLLKFGLVFTVFLPEPITQWETIHRIVIDSISKSRYQYKIDPHINFDIQVVTVSSIHRHQNPWKIDMFRMTESAFIELFDAIKRVYKRREFHSDFFVRVIWHSTYIYKRKWLVEKMSNWYRFDIFSINHFLFLLKYK